MGGKGSGPRTGVRVRERIFTPLLDARTGAMELARLEQDQETLSARRAECVAAVLKGTRESIGAANRYFFPGDTLGDLPADECGLAAALFDEQIRIVHRAMADLIAKRREAPVVIHVSMAGGQPTMEVR